MLRVMAGNGSPPPEFDFDEEHSYFMVRLPVHPSAGRPESQPESQPESLDRRIATELANAPRSKSEISLGLGQKSVSGELNKQVRLLRNRGFIEYTIPDKPKSRFQKYRLTDKGRAWLLRKAATGGDDA